MQIESFKNINKIISKKYKKEFIVLVLLMIFSALFELISLKFLYEILSYFSELNNQSETFLIKLLKGIPLDYSTETYLVSAFFLIFFIKTLVYLIYHHKQSIFKAYCTADVSARLFEGYMSLPKLFHLRSNISEIIKNINEESTHVNSVLEDITNILLEIIILLVVIFYLLSLNISAVLIIFISLITFSVLFHRINLKPITSMGKERVVLTREKLKSIYEGFTGNRAYEITNTKNFITNKFLLANHRLADINASITYRRVITKPIFEIFVLFIIILFFSYYFGTGNYINQIIPELGVFLMAGYRLVPSFARIVSSLQSYNYFIQSSNKLRKDFDKFEYSKKDSKDTISNFKFTNSINLKNIHFSYHKIKPKEDKENYFIFKDLNMKINLGDKIGIIGRSGTGKSTLLDVIMGLISVNSGSILIDGQKIENIKKSWQKMIGCVPQDVYIVDYSIKKNIAFGIPVEKINNQKIAKAIKYANIDEFCEGLKFGVNTLIGKDGSRISGGQKQRIGIARAIYNEPEILIFDEATTALDEITERKIIEEINNNFKDKTIILVSHKKENLKFCNKIFEVDNKNIQQLK